MKYEHFDLLKFKFVDKKVEISYFNLEDRETTENPKTNHLPHQKLLDVLDEFKEIFADSSGHLIGHNFARQALTGIERLDLLEQAMKGYNEVVDNHNVSGVAYIDGNLKGIQISGSYKNVLGSYGYAANRIYFENDKIDYGPKAQELSEKLRERVFAFLFKGEVGAKKKKAGEEDPAQLKITDAEQQAVNPDAATATTTGKTGKAAKPKPKADKK